MMAEFTTDNGGSGNAAGSGTTHESSVKERTLQRNAVSPTPLPLLSPGPEDGQHKHEAAGHPAQSLINEKEEDWDGPLEVAGEYSSDEEERHTHWDSNGSANNSEGSNHEKVMQPSPSAPSATDAHRRESLPQWALQDVEPSTTIAMGSETFRTAVAGHRGSASSASTHIANTVSPPRVSTLPRRGSGTAVKPSSDNDRSMIEAIPMVNLTLSTDVASPGQGAVNEPHLSPSVDKAAVPSSKGEQDKEHGQEQEQEEAQQQEHDNDGGVGLEAEGTVPLQGPAADNEQPPEFAEAANQDNSALSQPYLPGLHSWDSAAAPSLADVVDLHARSLSKHMYSLASHAASLAAADAAIQEQEQELEAWLQSSGVLLPSHNSNSARAAQARHAHQLGMGGTSTKAVKRNGSQKQSPRSPSQRASSDVTASLVQSYYNDLKQWANIPRSGSQAAADIRSPTSIIPPPRSWSGSPSLGQPRMASGGGAWASDSPSLSPPGPSASDSPGPPPSSTARARHRARLRAQELLQQEKEAEKRKQARAAALAMAERVRHSSSKPRKQRVADDHLLSQLSSPSSLLPSRGRFPSRKHHISRSPSPQRRHRTASPPMNARRLEFADEATVNAPFSPYDAQPRTHVSSPVPHDKGGVTSDTRPDASRAPVASDPPSPSYSMGGSDLSDAPHSDYEQPFSRHAVYSDEQHFPTAQASHEYFQIDTVREARPLPQSGLTSVGGPLEAWAPANGSTRTHNAGVMTGGASEGMHTLRPSVPSRRREKFFYARSTVASRIKARKTEGGNESGSDHDEATKGVIAPSRRASAGSVQGPPKHKPTDTKRPGIRSKLETRRRQSQVPTQDTARPVRHSIAAATSNPRSRPRRHSAGAGAWAAKQAEDFQRLFPYADLLPAPSVRPATSTVAVQTDFSDLSDGISGLEHHHLPAQAKAVPGSHLVSGAKKSARASIPRLQEATAAAGTSQQARQRSTGISRHPSQQMAPNQTVLGRSAASDPRPPMLHSPPPSPPSHGSAVHHGTAPRKEETDAVEDDPLAAWREKAIKFSQTYRASERLLEELLVPQAQQNNSSTTRQPRESSLLSFSHSRARTPSPTFTPSFVTRGSNLYQGSVGRGPSTSAASAHRSPYYDAATPVPSVLPVAPSSMAPPAAPPSFASHSLHHRLSTATPWALTPATPQPPSFTSPPPSASRPPAAVAPLVFFSQGIPTLSTSRSMLSPRFGTLAASPPSYTPSLASTRTPEAHTSALPSPSLASLNTTRDGTGDAMISEKKRRLQEILAKAQGIVGDSLPSSVFSVG